MNIITQKWLNYAKADLEAAEILSEQPRSTYSYQLAVLHCHQAIEKILKTVLVSQNKEVKRIHDLIRLLELTEIKDIPQELQDYITELNPHYQLPRYPDIVYKGPILKYNKEIAQHHFQKTKKLFLWIEKKLKSKK